VTKSMRAGLAQPYFAVIVLNRLEPENLISYLPVHVSFQIHNTFLVYRDSTGVLTLYVFMVVDDQS